RLDAAVYQQYWNGLRVRVGVHTGLCDIRHDEVTKGYDYYGDTANVAARTEGVGNGGQVLLTRAAYLALSTAEREQLEVTALGAVALRGVPRPVEMYQLDAVPGRTFAPLRLDRLMPELDGDGGDTSSSGEASASTAMSAVSHTIVSVLAVLLGTFAAPQRLKSLRPLCERWRVAVPHAVRAGNEEDACRVAMERLAVKMGHVMEKGAKRASVECNPRKTSLPLMSFFRGDDELHVPNPSVGGDESLGRRPPRSSFSQSTLPATEEVHSGPGDPFVTVHVRRCV
ncbi:receptor-type adenylate cyclase, partial [Trypanosoma conorhini]